MFIAALFFIIAKTWKKSKRPSVGEWLNKLYCIQTTECNSVQKRNELSSHEKTWKKFKCILLSERKQSEKDTYCMSPTIGHSGKCKTIDSKKISDCHELEERMDK